jgi:hypothetical protein
MFSMGAGAAKSLGRKILALTANKATKKIITVRRGRIY